MTAPVLYPNQRLAAMLAESGMSRTRFARAVRQVCAEQGTTVRYEHPSVSRWLSGVTPRRDTAHAMTIVFGRVLRRTVTLADIGLEPAAPAPAPEPADAQVTAAPASWPQEFHEVRARLNWLADEIAALSRSLAVTGPRGTGAW